MLQFVSNLHKNFNFRKRQDGTKGLADRHAVCNLFNLFELFCVKHTLHLTVFRFGLFYGQNSMRTHAHDPEE